jgi:hypothetical protein
MATTEPSEQELRRELQEERERLAEAVDTLRDELGAATDIRSKLPIIAGGAFALGFLKAGGVGATMRYLARRGREGDEKAAFGRFRLIDRG